ncbi:MAG: AraC family transcriptional regulator [Rhizobium sp.]|nr:AraC family transcriptional regulator [Rhizobium sp.]
MQTVFDTSRLTRDRRNNAWQEALCDLYVNLDTNIIDREDYRGFVKEARFGAVTITDTLLSKQLIKRRRKHLSRVDKDCFYLQLIQRGRTNVIQHNHELASNGALGTLFYASETYDLQCVDEVRAYYLEIPRDSLNQRLQNKSLPVSLNFSTGAGIGRVAADFCLAIASQSESIGEADREVLGDELLDIVALAIDRAPRPEAIGNVVPKAKLHTIKAYIEQNLSNPVLSLPSIAKANGISLRYLHYLFRQEDMSPSDWIWTRRLQRCHDLLATSQGMDRSVTDIAYSAGFSSSSHFSNMFKAKFGFRPSDLRRKNLI